MVDATDGIRRGPFGSALKKDTFVSDSDYVVYEQQNVIYDRFETRYNITKEKFQELKKFSVQPGDFLMSGAGTIGKITRVPEGTKQGVFNQALIRFRLNRNIMDSQYFLQLMREDNMQKNLTGANPGSAITNLVPMAEVKKWNVLLPSKEEQQKIGSFFKNIDSLITLHQRKLNILKQLKQAMLQKIFPIKDKNVPALRFDGFKKEWEQYSLKNILIKNSKKNKDLSIKNVESVSNKTGFTRQTDQFDDYSVASADLSNYYVIREKQFAYNPSRINVGSIAYKSVGEQTSVVSPLYVSFSTTDILNDNFLWYWFKTSIFERQRQTLSEGGVRDTLSFNQLSEMKLLLPDFEEQSKMGSFLINLDYLITFHQLKLSKLKSLKTAYLQLMFI